MAKIVKFDSEARALMIKGVEYSCKYCQGYSWTKRT